MKSETTFSACFLKIGAQLKKEKKLVTGNSTGVCVGNVIWLVHYRCKNININQAGRKM